MQRSAPEQNEDWRRARERAESRRVRFRDRLNVVALAHRNDDFGAAVRAGLEARPKHLPCRYFYDDAGSRLFEQICDLPEYYLTRAEREILAHHADEIAAFFPNPTTLIELGSGNSEKTRFLLSAFLRRHRRASYVPIDISRQTLEKSAESLLADYDGLRVLAVGGEYGPALRWLRGRTSSPRLVLWLGSSIGNFTAPEAVRFLADLARELGEEDHVLIGADLRKDTGDLLRAYDDAAGVTAAFNKNLLVRINRDLDADFELEAFRHEARWNDEQSRVEMHLVSTRAQRVRIETLAMHVDLAADESIHTEDSHKYSEERLLELGRIAGLRARTTWHDKGRRFCLALFSRAQRPARRAGPARLP